MHVAALGEARQHAKDLTGGTAEPARDVALREAFDLVGEELEDVESLFERGRAVASLVRRRVRHDA